MAVGTGIKKCSEMSRCSLVKALIEFAESGKERKRHVAGRCEHGVKAYCKQCGGRGLCKHGNRKYECGDCDTPACYLEVLQDHPGKDYENCKKWELCKFAAGTGIKKYSDMNKQELIIALAEFDASGQDRKKRPVNFCEHGNKYYCKVCGGEGLCRHEKRKDLCKECGGSSVCLHGRIKYSCQVCKDCKI